MNTRRDFIRSSLGVIAAAPLMPAIGIPQKLTVRQESLPSVSLHRIAGKPICWISRNIRVPARFVRVMAQYSEPLRAPVDA